jgi:hypothetical protein
MVFCFCGGSPPRWYHREALHRHQVRLHGSARRITLRGLGVRRFGVQCGSKLRADSCHIGRKAARSTRKKRHDDRNDSKRCRCCGARLPKTGRQTQDTDSDRQSTKRAGHGGCITRRGQTIRIGGKPGAGSGPNQKGRQARCPQCQAHPRDPAIRARPEHHLPTTVRLERCQA